ncbi:MAG: hypothetical protein JST90_01925 [Bacteroidetes bacterium]|nr:hypothetical protein [Bacteroidota bacterium]
MKILVRLIIFLLLTLLTQVGGVIYLLCWPLFYLIEKKAAKKSASFLLKPLSFLVVYILLSATVIPMLAGVFGRAALPVFGGHGIRPNNIMTCLLNRHYVRRSLRDVLIEVADKQKENGISLPLRYLDAGFPFVNGWPMLPHLSHNDGRKLDLSYYYQDKENAEALTGTPAWSGYGFCEAPVNGEVDMPCQCEQSGHTQYSILRKLSSDALHEIYNVDAGATATLIRALAAEPSVSMIFIEPHLKHRWQLDDVSKIKFHGCHAVRHDDHIHIQIR